MVAWAGQAWAASLQNGGFETGDLTGWKTTTSGNASVRVRSDFLGWSASEGAHFALLESQSQSRGARVTLRQRFQLDAGDRVSFDYFLRSCTSCSAANDKSRLSLSGLGATLLELAGNGNDTPAGVWLSAVSLPAPAAGKYTLEFKVRIPRSDANYAQLGLDNIRAQSGGHLIPEPVTAIGLFAGVAGLAGYVRKRMAG